MDDKQSERWKPVVGYEGIYSVSDMGRIRRDAPAKRARVGYVLRPSLASGYPRVALCSENDRNHQFVHRIVARAFIGQPPDRQPHVNHKNGDRSDARLQNLEYVSPEENFRHAELVLGSISFPFGGKKPQAVRGERHYRARLTAEKVHKIRALRRSARASYRKLARMYNVSTMTVFYAANANTWSHVV